MSEFEKRYEKLNPEQKKAVDHIEGPLLVVAGPGTGKTEILGLRTVNILQKTGVSPGSILCLTFTNAAAYNMRQRLSGLIGRDAYRLAIHTFHSFGVEIIGSYPEYFYGGSRFYPLDDVSRLEILEDLIGALPHDNPIYSVNPEGKYNFLDSATTAIGKLKKAGLTPGDFREIIAQNEEAYGILNPLIHRVFGETVSKRTADDIRQMLDELAASDPGSPYPGVSSVLKVLGDSLSGLLSELGGGTNTPASKWKTKYTEKGADGSRIHKSSGHTDKLYALAGLYESYQDRIHKMMYYDYDDMIIQTIEAIEKNPALAERIRDRYEYILVDEFQDTNGAQMKLLRLVAGEGGNGRGPNVMAVGDDDQSIYKFQGAELANLLEFTETYPGAEIITITSNYRSTEDVLEVAEYIIEGAENRLVKRVSEIDKKITAENKSIPAGKIISLTFPSRLHEHHFAAAEIKRLMDAGKSPDEIAVITRRHDDLAELAKVLGSLGVPLTYERFNNVLDEPHVRQLIRMTEFAASLGRKRKEDADDLLPEILSYPFWGLSRKAVWGISREAARGRRYWLDVMAEHEDRRVRDIADFFIYMGEVSKHDTLERVLDLLMGADAAQAPDDGDDDSGGYEGGSGRFVSPFKEYYFGEKKLEENKLEYTRFLSCLRTFVEALREYKKAEVLGVDDLAAFVDLHLKNRVPLIDNSVFLNSGNAVSLLTAHGAKGLEFDTVFILSCQHDIWAGAGKSSNLQFPPNLPIAPASDDTDDKLRLFYVAVTRAKSNLFLTSYETKDSGKESSRLGFITPPSIDDAEKKNLRAMLTCAVDSEGIAPLPDDAEVLETSWEAFHAPPVVLDENSVLEPILKDYKLSVTHLNNFLDVRSGGPRLFFMQNLLRFPQAKSAAGSYGSAVHRVMHEIHLHLRNNGGGYPSVEFLLNRFDEELRGERLGDRDYAKYSKRGKDMLTIFFEKKLEGFKAEHHSELNFDAQGVVVENARLTGKIDKMITSGGEAVVHDYKTGKAKPDWKGAGQYEPAQMHQYRNQILFYKILVENSRDYAEYKVNRGVLEFIEHLDGALIDLPLDINREDYERITKLASIVYGKIMNLDFPDVSKYSKDLKGIKQFEDDLLDGKT
jgi:DNA helicase-2/ATP-dependent DNA helicase PcrA